MPNSNNILVLAGGYDQISLIRHFKKRGHYVVLADYLDNPPAKSYADKHFQISTLDIDEIESLASSEHIDLVVTACTDQALLTAAIVSERLGLPTYISSDTALKVTNKAYMKNRMVESKIPTANSIICENMHEAKRALEQISLPGVVKPVDCNSSKGVIRIDSEGEFDDAAKSAFSMSRDGRIIVEEFIEGVEVTIDAWIDHGKSQLISISQIIKIDDPGNHFLICKNSYPVAVDNPEELSRNAADVAQSLATSFELPNGPLLIQAIYNNQDLKVIEFSARMGGGTKCKLIERMTNIDIMSLYVSLVLGERLDESALIPIPSDKKVEIDYLYSKNGILREITGIESCLNNSYIEDCFIYKTNGSAITSRNSSSDRVAGILIEADTYAHLQEKRHKALSTIDYNDGKQSLKLDWNAFYD